MLSLCPLLRRGDVLVADRGFCSYAQVAVLARHGGVDVVMRLHQRRPAGRRAGRAGAGDGVDRWARPSSRRRWMSPSLWSALRERLDVRIVRYAVPRRGCRPRVVRVATTLLDPLAYPAETIMRLYGHRWN